MANKKKSVDYKEYEKWFERAKEDLSSAEYNFDGGKYYAYIKGIKMGRRKIIKQKLIEFKEKVNKGIGVKRMILFGSRAKGKTGKDSDFDLIIVSDGFKKLDFFQRGAKMYDYWNLRYPVDFLCYTSDEFDDLKNKITIVRGATKEGIEV